MLYVICFPSNTLNSCAIIDKPLAQPEPPNAITLFWGRCDESVYTIQVIERQCRGLRQKSVSPLCGGLLAQSAERGANNAKVVSSILTQAMFFVYLIGFNFASTQPCKYGGIRCQTGNRTEKNVLLHKADDSMT